MQFSRTIRDLTIEELVGECFMPRLNVPDYVANAEYSAWIQSLLERHIVGGFCVFGGSRALVRNTLTELQRRAINAHGIPLIFSGDFEFGLPMRLSDGTEFPDAMALARSGDAQLVESVGRAIAEEMKEIGVAWNFAPVADVNSNPKNPIINTRSFGENPESVSLFVKAFCSGARNVGIASTAKHFPGHGDTAVDSHRELPVIHADRSRFDALELKPFVAAIEAGVESIMTGHIACPELARSLGASVSEAEYPASLSHAIVTSLLRDELSFNGIITTDALEMQAITKHFGDDEACTLAFNAGSDVLLLPKNIELGYQHVLERVRSGSVSEDRVLESATRILDLKRWVQVDPMQELVELSSVDTEHLSLAHEAADRALEIKGRVVASLAEQAGIIICDNRETSLHKANLFKEQLLTLGAKWDIVTPDKLQHHPIPESGSIVITCFHRARGYINGTEESVSLPSALRNYLAKLRTESRQMAGLILFGSPYLDAELNELTPEFIIKTYSESFASIEAVISKLKS